jgi:hypothetical protein
MAGGGQAAATTSAVINGDFEQGKWVGWSESASRHGGVVVPVAPYGVTPHSGNWIAWLGDEPYERAEIYQTDLFISTPTRLRLWYWSGSEDACGYDYGRMTVNNEIVHVWNLCYDTNTYGWTPLEIDLNAYNGQTIILSIEVSTDGSYYSGLLIDDVSLYSTFHDVAYGYWAQGFVQRLYDAGITGGCGNNLYCPESVVTRSQMAVFLERGIHGSAYNPPAPGTLTGFADVPISYWSASWIKQLAADGITGGCATTPALIYCPEDPVTRAQMAVFLLRSKYGASYTPPGVSGSTGFSDVPTTYWAAAWIKQLVAEGIATGCGTGTYCPEAAVTRAQMAVFLVRTFGLP